MAVAYLNHLEHTFFHTMTRWFQRGNPVRSLAPFASDARPQSASAGQGVGYHSLGEFNYCFQALVDKGCVKIQNSSGSKHKMDYVYLLTPVGVTEKSVLTARFLKRKLEEYETLRVEIDLLNAKVSQIAKVIS